MSEWGLPPLPPRDPHWDDETAYRACGGPDLPPKQRWPVSHLEFVD